MFALLRICRVLTGQNLVPQHFWISLHRSGTNSEMARFVGTSVKVGATTHEFALNANARELLALLLPADDRGPVLLHALRRLAAICRSLATGQAPDCSLEVCSS